MFNFFISSDGIIKVSEPEDVSDPEPEETEEEDSNPSVKEKKSSKKDHVKVEDETGFVLCKGNLDAEVKNLRSALQRSEKEMRKLRSKLSECHTLKIPKSSNMGGSTKAPQKALPKVKNQTKKSSQETALKSQNVMLKHALNSLAEELRQEDNTKKNQVGFLQQLMAFVFNSRK